MTTRIEREVSEHPNQDGDAAEADAAAERSKRILVIDDQDDERAIQRAMLSHLGYTVQEAPDGESGLRTATESPPDLILLDVAMPHMDGFAVCRALRSDRRTTSVPILLFTASVVGDLDQRAEQAGADGVLTKPIDPRRVAEEVARHLERAGP